MVQNGSNMGMMKVPIQHTNSCYKFCNNGESSNLIETSGVTGSMVNMFSGNNSVLTSVHP